MADQRTHAVPECVSCIYVSFFILNLYIYIKYLILITYSQVEFSQTVSCKLGFIFLMQMK